ncbi:hypothetical protein JMUB7529_28270 [Staphylococcus aureus]
MSRGLGDVYKRQESGTVETNGEIQYFEQLNMDVENDFNTLDGSLMSELHILSLIHI